MPDRTPVVILCGGRGTRLREHARELPKALVDVGGRPIVDHVVDLYLAHGFRRVILAAGYRGELLAAHVAGREWPDGVHVECVDTGADTETGGRVLALAPELAGCGCFCLTYADGLADIDLAALLAFHGAHGALATITVVRPELQFGVAQLDDEDRVLGFVEKPRSERWINGGFMCLQEEVLARLDGDAVLERGPLAGLAADGELRAYRHEGFWRCMDTYKDAVALNDMCAGGAQPWLAPAVHAAS
ncbi:MAG TPA: sugar phosphate nucleotidyltransferase [Solirubrobacteraceae bacterium]|nr:sugar phosphate nucleotidyltransferase [Solirubrobacteraceae bacterium]